MLMVIAAVPRLSIKDEDGERKNRMFSFFICIIPVDDVAFFPIMITLTEFHTFSILSL